MEKYYNLYKILITVMGMTGLYLPSIEKIYGSKWYIKSLKYTAIILGTVVFVFLLSSVKFVFYDEADLSDKVFGSQLLFYGLLMTFTHSSFYFNRKEFEKLFELSESLFEEELFPEDRQELLRKSRKSATKYFLIFEVPSTSYAFFYGFISYFKPDKKLNHPSGIPYRYETPDFELMVTFETVVAVAGYSMLVTYDALLMVFLSVEDAEFAHLKKSLARILEMISVTDYGDMPDVNYLIPEKMKKALDEIDKNIRIWVSHHQGLLRFHKEVQRIYYYSLSMKYLFLFFIICFSSFLTVTGRFDVYDMLLSVTFCCFLYTVFYTNIRLADSIKYLAHSLFEEAFSKSWYLFPKKLKTNVRIIMLQCQRPVKYKALHIFDMTSETFLKIFTSAYSFCTFLLQIKH